MNHLRMSPCRNICRGLQCTLYIICVLYLVHLLVVMKAVIRCTVYIISSVLTSPQSVCLGCSVHWKWYCSWAVFCSGALRCRLGPVKNELSFTRFRTCASVAWTCGFCLCFLSRVHGRDFGWLRILRFFCGTRQNLGYVGDPKGFSVTQNRYD
jgi:hypothetical protein